MHVAPPEVRAGVFINLERFALVSRVIGHTSDAALARAIGMNRETIGRARDGILGERFIAAVLKEFGEHEEELAKLGLTAKFEDIFEIRDKAAVA